MRISCPFCEAAYDVPASVIQARRRLRCARCQSDWSPQAESSAEPVPPEPAPLAIAPPAVAVAPAERLAPEVPPAPPPAGAPAWLVLAAWVLSFALLGAAGWGAVTWRQPVMQAWPASVRLYAVLGLSK
jgi:predicted Zn finger-like uncharacterized protein